ncbi:ead/Ea22-like family protein [Citrobacter freundii]|uniref:ead/Ea22-like family protein n=1 Tax=Citrobacter freundii TaxID=546 RepID=UPI0015F9C444|nr:ead/Ea22-like family protein [Citrobacter freundii]MBA7989762.1 ead/Ea22-like family protein [Citrobacter freundii]
MTALNKQALRQLAEKATPGPWEMEHENIWFKDAEGYTKHLMYAYQGDDVDDQQDHDNTAYIAAFNPKVVLALLDELEAAEKRIAELEARQLVVKIPAYVDGRTLGYGEVNHMIDLCVDAFERACHSAGINLTVEG